MKTYHLLSGMMLWHWSWLSPTPQAILTIAAEDHSRPCGGGHGGESVRGGESSRSSRTGWGVKWWGYRTGEIIGLAFTFGILQLVFTFSFILVELLDWDHCYMEHLLTWVIHMGLNLPSFASQKQVPGFRSDFRGRQQKPRTHSRPCHCCWELDARTIGWLKFKMNRMCDPLGLIIVCI